MSAKPSKRDARILREWASGVPVAESAARTGLTQQRIYQIARKYSAGPRPVIPRPASAKAKLIEACRPEIEAAIASGKSVKEVARQLGVADTALHKNGVSNPGYWTSDAEKCEWERMYVREEMSTPQIARRTGAPQSTIAKHLKKRGLTRDLQRNDNRRHWEDLYVTQNRTAAEISKLTGASASTIKAHIKSVGLSRPPGRRATR